jgi:hypothetical protein
MKHVVNSDEVYHLWRWNTEGVNGWARNSSDSVSYHGDKAYSYATVIAAKVDHAGKQAILVSHENLGITSQKHQRMLSKALGYRTGLDNDPITPTSELRIAVWCNCTDAILSEYMIGEIRAGSKSVNTLYNVKVAVKKIEEAVNKAKRARQNKPWYLDTITSTIDTLKAYCAYYEIPEPDICKSTDLNALTNTIYELREEERKAYAARQEVLRLRLETEKKRRELELQAYLKRWIAGEDVSRTRVRETLTAYMRIEIRKNDEGSTTSIIMTNWGASIDIHVARKALPLILRLIDGTLEVPPTFHVGTFVCSGLTPTGNVKIGCHVFSVEEIQRMATLLTS